MDLPSREAWAAKKRCFNLRSMDPQVRAIVSSGYSDDPVMGAIREYGFIGVMTKPYSLKDAESKQYQKIITGSTNVRSGIFPVTR